MKVDMYLRSLFYRLVNSASILILAPKAYFNSVTLTKFDYLETAMLHAIFLIFVLQLAGEFLQKYFELTVPGPVIGLLLMLGLLLFLKPSRGSDSGFGQQVMSTANTLLQHLSLLFVPIGVGVVMHLQLLESQLAKVLGVIVIGTLLTLIFTALLFQWLRKRGADE